MITEQAIPQVYWTSQKSKQEIEYMREGGSILRHISDLVLSEVKPGVSLGFLNDIAEALIKKNGKASFKTAPKGRKRYGSATCINVNSGVVHGVPHYNVCLKEGDIVSLDVGLIYKKLHTDLSDTVPVGKISKETERFLAVGKDVLRQAIDQARLGRRVGHISQAIEEGVKAAGYEPVKALVGHAIGKHLHELPNIPCYLDRPVKETDELVEGWTISIEVIYTAGDPDVVELEDGWTIQTADGKIAGLFEETVAVAQNGPFILTQKD